MEYTVTKFIVYLASSLVSFGFGSLGRAVAVWIRHHVPMFYPSLSFFVRFVRLPDSDSSEFSTRFDSSLVTRPLNLYSSSNIPPSPYPHMCKGPPHGEDNISFLEMGGIWDLNSRKTVRKIEYSLLRSAHRRKRTRSHPSWRSDQPASVATRR